MQKAKSQDYWKNPEDLSQLVTDIIKNAKKAGASSCEVDVNLSKGLSSSVRKSIVDKIEFHRSKSINITTYCGQKKGSVSISDLTEAQTTEAINAAIKIATYTQEDEYAGLADKKFMATEFPDLDLYHPKEIDTEFANNIAKKCEQSAFDYSDKIFNSDGASFSKSSNISVYGNSHGFIGKESSTLYSLSLAVLAKKNPKEKNSSKDMQRDYDYTVGRSFEDLTVTEDVGKSAAYKTILRLGARKIPTQKAPIIFHAGIASNLFRSFLSGISGSNIYRKSSFLLDSLNKQIFPKYIQIKEDPFILKGLGSSAFDAEGVATKKRNIVEDGVVQTYILNSYSARKLKMEPTGHAGGVHNLSVVDTNANDANTNSLNIDSLNVNNLEDQNLKTTNFDSLINKMGKGLLVTETMGHGVNIVTGDFSQGAFGYWVENGEIQYPVHEITIASNLLDMFKNIIAVGNDVDIRKNIRTGSVLINEMMIAGE